MVELTATLQCHLPFCLLCRSYIGNTSYTGAMSVFGIIVV